MEFLNLLVAIPSALSIYLTIVHFLEKRRRVLENDRIDQTKTNSALELKVKELEGRIAAQYSELSQKLANVERALEEDKASKITFESRVLSLLDKSDTKIERIQDLILRVLVQNKQDK